MAKVKIGDVEKGQKFMTVEGVAQISKSDKTVRWCDADGNVRGIAVLVENVKNPKFILCLPCTIMVELVEE